MQANVISTPSVTFTVTRKNRPFGNNFVVQRASMQANEIEAVVECTKDSREPGRTYYCIYTTSGVLLACNTLN